MNLLTLLKEKQAYYARNGYDGARLLADAIARIEELEAARAAKTPPTPGRYFVEQCRILGHNRHGLAQYRIRDTAVHRPDFGPQAIAWTVDKGVADRLLAELNGTRSESAGCYEQMWIETRGQLHKMREELDEACRRREELRELVRTGNIERATAMAATCSAAVAMWKAAFERESAESARLATVVNNLETQLKAIHNAANERRAGMTLPEYITHVQTLVRGMRAIGENAELRLKQVENQRDDYQRLWGLARDNVTKLGADLSAARDDVNTSKEALQSIHAKAWDGLQKL